MTVQPDPETPHESQRAAAFAGPRPDVSAAEASSRPGSSTVSPDLLASMLTALLARVPESAVSAVADDPALAPAVRSALVEILSGQRAAADAASDIGDLLRAQGGPDDVGAVNEFYRMAFYLGTGWEEAARNPLFARFAANKAGRPFDKWVHYFEIYQRTLQPFVGTAPRVLEIGVFHGGGLEQLRFFLGPDAHLVGIDVDPAAQAACRGRFPVEIGDQGDPAFLAKVVADHGPFDVIIDDGGHTMTQQIGSLEHLFGSLASGGRYMVEDTHTSYWSDYQDGDRTFIEWVKDRLDDINAYHHSRERGLPIWATEVLGIHVYDSVVVLDKGRHHPPFAEVAGSGSALLDSRRSELDLLQYQAAVNLRTAQVQQTRDDASAAVAQARQKLEDADELFRSLESQRAGDQEAQRESGEELQRIQADLQRTQVDQQRTQADLQRTQRALRDLRTSKSWRWTEPLRRTFRGLGG